MNSEEWRQQRIARNESMFRDINERLEAGLKQVRHSPELQQFVCECGNRDCEAFVLLSFEEYEGVRADSRHFAILPGHAIPQAERVVGGNERFEIVEKQGSSVEVVDAADHRAPGDSGLRDR